MADKRDALQKLIDRGTPIPGLPFLNNGVIRALGKDAADVLGPLLSALSAPGNALAGNYPPVVTPEGRVDPYSPMIPDVANLAGSIGAGAYAVPKPANSLGMFGGLMAKTADEAAFRRAADMDEAGASPDEILKATGWFKGADKRWKFEIDDSRSVFNERAIPHGDPFGKQKVVAQQLEAKGYKVPKNALGGLAAGAGDLVKPEDWSAAWNYAHANPPEAPSVRLGEALDHPDLYAAYPDIADIPLSREVRAQLKGSYHPEKNAMTTGGGLITEAPGSQHSTLLHEIQHAVQERENFGKGASPDEFDDAADYFAAVHDAQTLKLFDDDVAKFKDAVGREPAPRAVKLASAYDEGQLYSMPASPKEAYKWQRGEVEARNVQYRQNLSAQERREKHPFSTQDVPTSRQIRSSGQVLKDAGLYQAGVPVIPGTSGSGEASGGDPGSSLPPEALAFLDAISGPESRGKYNARYPSTTFSGYDDHPRTHATIKSGPNKGKTSSAAGRYQITETTWDQIIQPALNLPDFSPQSQDIAAWYLAQKDYGGNLLGTLRSGDPDAIGRAAKKLAGTWTSLPGGIEATTSTKRFLNAYNDAFTKRNVAPIPATRTPPGASAVAAIDSAFPPPPVNASAYAPPAGSASGYLGVTPNRLVIPPGTPRTTATTVPPRNALPGLPATSAATVPSVPAMSVPSVAAAPVPPSLPAPSPLIPTTRARTPWSPVQEYAALNPPSPKPEVAPPLGYTLDRYADTYQPLTETMRDRIGLPTEGLTTRTVRTVPIDPTTGGLAKPPSLPFPPSFPRATDPAWAGDTSAASATVTPSLSGNGKVENPGLYGVWNDDYDLATNPIRLGFNDTGLGSLVRTKPTPPAVEVAALDTRPKGPANRGGLNKTRTPTIGINKGGVPYDVASVERTKNSTPGVMPPTGTATLPPVPVSNTESWRRLVPPTTKVAAMPPLNAFGYTPVPDRLTPGGDLVVSDEPAIPATPGYRIGSVPFGPPMPPGRGTSIKVGARDAGLGSPFPTGMERWASPFGFRPPPPGSEGPNGYIPAADPITKMALDAVNSPGAKFAGEMNAGEHPIAAWLVKMFGPKEGRVSTARSIQPPRYGVRGDLASPPPTGRTLSPATTRLVGSGGNNAWRLIMDNNTDASDQPPRERRYLSR